MWGEKRRRCGFDGCSTRLSLGWLEWLCLRLLSVSVTWEREKREGESEVGRRRVRHSSSTTKSRSRRQSAKFSHSHIKGRTFALAHSRTSAAEPTHRVRLAVLLAERSGHTSVCQRNGACDVPVSLRASLY